MCHPASAVGTLQATHVAACPTCAGRGVSCRSGGRCRPRSCLSLPSAGSRVVLAAHSLQPRAHLPQPRFGHAGAALADERGVRRARVYAWRSGAGGLALLLRWPSCRLAHLLGPRHLQEPRPGSILARFLLRSADLECTRGVHAAHHVLSRDHWSAVASRGVGAQRPQRAGRDAPAPPAWRRDPFQKGFFLHTHT